MFLEKLYPAALVPLRSFCLQDKTEEKGLEMSLEFKILKEGRHNLSDLFSWTGWTSDT